MDIRQLASNICMWGQAGRRGQNWGEKLQVILIQGVGRETFFKKANTKAPFRGILEYASALEVPTKSPRTRSPLLFKPEQTAATRWRQTRAWIPGRSIHSLTTTPQPCITAAAGISQPSLSVSCQPFTTVFLWDNDSHLDI